MVCNKKRCNSGIKLKFYVKIILCTMRIDACNKRNKKRRKIDFNRYCLPSESASIHFFFKMMTIKSLAYLIKHPPVHLEIEISLKR